MELTKEQIGHIANLARLELSKKEAEKFSGQISSILGYVKKLQEIDLSRIEPTLHAVGLSNVLREDKIEPRDGREMEDLIEMAPESEGGLVKARAVFKMNHES
jgi:aspartyl-tRNA(Asn)/glutamyl-tRNA(Gln) amidotransferase subunit C